MDEEAAGDKPIPDGGENDVPTKKEENDEPKKKEENDEPKKKGEEENDVPKKKGENDVPKKKGENDVPKKKKENDVPKNKGEEENDVPKKKVLWHTRETVSKENRAKYLKTTLREILVYLLFLTAVTYAVFGQTSSNDYFYTNSLHRLFVESPISPDYKTTTFQNMATIDDFWQYLENGLMTGLYWEISSGDRNLTDEELGYILYQNKLQGVPQLRQVRVRNDSCKVQKEFETRIKVCYGAFSKANEMTTKLPGVYGTVHSDAVDTFSYYGLISKYGSSGYVVQLNILKYKSQFILASLRANNWISRETRAVFIDFSAYNSNLDLVLVVRLVGEFPLTGGVVTSSSFRLVKLVRYSSINDYIVLVCEGVVVLLLVFYIIEEILELITLRLRYFGRFWNIFDLMVIGVCAAFIIFKALRYMQMKTYLSDLVKEPVYPSKFELFGFWMAVFDCAMAFTIFCCWIKLFKYASLNTTMAQLSDSLSSCAGELAWYTAMFFIIFLAFAQMGYVIFGSSLQNFSTFGDTVITLLRIILGDFDYEAFEQTDRIFAPIFYFFYIFFIYFVLFNVFLAIVLDAYSHVKMKTVKDSKGMEFSDYLFKTLFSCCGKKYREGIDQLCENWKEEMFEMGYSKDNVEIVISRHAAEGINNTTLLTPLQQKILKDDLEIIVQSDLSTLKLDRLEGRVAELEVQFEETKALHEKSEATKMQRQAAMSKLLDSIIEAENSNDEKKRAQIQKLVKDELAHMAISTPTS